MSFLRPKVRATQAPPPPVTEDTAGKQQEYEDMLRRRRGRASAILTGRFGGMRATAPLTAGKVLLGS